MARTKTTPRRGNKPTTVFVPRSQNTLNITDRIRDRQLKNQKVDSRVENCSDQKKNGQVVKTINVNRKSYYFDGVKAKRY